MSLRAFLRIASALTFCALSAPRLLAQGWIAPTAEELSMTSIPQVPGAPAVYLFKEQTADDSAHTHTYYVRLKVLTEGGKEYANVELPYTSSAARQSLDSIDGRTIHPDGSIIPFTGKPYEKIVQKTSDYKVKVKVFTLPNVEVGSIIEYRYKLHLDDYYFQHPDWMIQSELFTRKAHYMWRPTDILLTTADGKEESSRVPWTPILPPGVKVVETQLNANPYAKIDAGHSELNLTISDVPPIPREQYMPPMNSVSYRVMFYYTSYKTADEYWKAQGKTWSKTSDKFIGPGPAVKAAVDQLVSPSDTPDQKLHKIYAAVTALENTDFTRQHTDSEERAQGLKEVTTADDVLKRKRGTGDQIAALFVSMARSAGFKAYLMSIANRRERIFLTAYLNTGQLDDTIAVVSVDGRELLFDPGQRYCPYAQLSWTHSFSTGMRQTDNGTGLVNTGPNSYKMNHLSRIADLSIDDHGNATGTVTLKFTGDPALVWRQEALRGDDTSLNADLRRHLERMLPGGMEIRVTKVDNLTDPEQPLIVAYEVKGPIGSSTGKRLLVAADLFESNAKPRFPEPKRELAVDMHYASQVQDAVRYKLPPSLVIESAPTADKGVLGSQAAFDTSSKTAPGSITFYRNLTVGTTVFLPTEYADLRGFYSKLEAKDQETVILTRAPSATAGSSN